jgi:hypothetical protein
MTRKTNNNSHDAPQPSLAREISSISYVGLATQKRHMAAIAQSQIVVLELYPS